MPAEAGVDLHEGSRPARELERVCFERAKDLCMHIILRRGVGGLHDGDAVSDEDQDAERRGREIEEPCWPGRWDRRWSHG